jgi:hypothetical protein
LMQRETSPPFEDIGILGKNHHRLGMVGSEN